MVFEKILSYHIGRRVMIMKSKIVLVNNEEYIINHEAEAIIEDLIDETGEIANRFIEVAKGIWVSTSKIIKIEAI